MGALDEVRDLAEAVDPPPSPARCGTSSSVGVPEARSSGSSSHGEGGVDLDTVAQVSDEISRAST